MNDSASTKAFPELKASNNGDVASVIADFGARYGGNIVLDITSATGVTSTVSISTSIGEVNFTPIGFSFRCSSSTNCTSSNPQWLVTFLTNSARYVKVSASNDPINGASDLFLDAIYLA